jgi:hypothetical protein
VVTASFAPSAAFTSSHTYDVTTLGPSYIYDTSGNGPVQFNDPFTAE